MKKFLICVAIILFGALPVCADDVDLPSSGDLWDNWNGATQDGREVKPVSDEDFDKAIEQVKNKKNKWVNRLKKKQVPKGEEFHNSNETEVITKEADKDTLPVLSIPVELQAGEDVLPVGHYQIKGEKDENGKLYINFYQAQYLMAKFPAVETSDDFDEDSITFGKWYVENENEIKVIFGTLDFNAYTIIPIAPSAAQQ